MVNDGLLGGSLGLSTVINGCKDGILRAMFVGIGGPLLLVLMNHGPWIQKTGFTGATTERFRGDPAPGSDRARPCPRTNS